MEHEPLRLWHALGGTAALVTLFFGIFGAIIIAVALSAMARTRRFIREGVKTDAIVTGKAEEPRLRPRGRRRTDWFLSFRHQTAEGQTVSARSPVPRRDYMRVQTGEKIPVTYLPETPDVVAIAPGLRTLGARVALIFGMLMVTLYLGVAGSNLISTWHAISVRDHGERLEVDVLAIERTSVRINKIRQFRLVWRMSDGREGRSWMRARSEFGDLAVGDRVIVYVDPGDPETSYWEGDTGPRG
ncbi:MAG: DUF3592 domain-containing protein [Pseudomonadota bacterium]